MKNIIIEELRETRIKLDRELQKNPQKTQARWREIEKEFKGKIVHRSPKLLKKKAA